VVCAGGGGGSGCWQAGREEGGCAAGAAGRPVVCLLVTCGPCRQHLRVCCAAPQPTPRRRHCRPRLQYNSVRLFDDYGKGPPAPIKLGSNGAAAATQVRRDGSSAPGCHPSLPAALDMRHAGVLVDACALQHTRRVAPPSTSRRRGRALRPTLALPQAARSWGLAEEQVVVNNTGCDSPALVAKALRQAGGNVDLAVEMVIEWMGEEGGGEGDGEGVGEAAGGSGPGAAAGAALQEAQPAAHAASDSRAAAGAAAASGGEAGRAAGGCAEGGTEGCPGEAGDGGCGPPSSSCSAEADGGSQAGGGGTARSQQQEQESGPPSEHSSTGRKQGQPAPKKPARNKPCACGSGRKHKDCCGAAKAAAERRKKALLDSLDTTEVVASVATLCI